MDVEDIVKKILYILMFFIPRRIRIGKHEWRNRLFVLTKKDFMSNFNSIMDTHYGTLADEDSKYIFRLEDEKRICFIEEFPAKCRTIKVINCGLMEAPRLKPGLIFLDLSGNPIKEIPDLPSTVKDVKAKNTRISKDHRTYLRLKYPEVKFTFDEHDYLKFFDSE